MLVPNGTSFARCMNGLASLSPHETEYLICVCHANTHFEHILLLVIPGGSCVYGGQLTHHLSIVAYDVKRLEGFIQLLDKGTSKFLVGHFGAVD